MRIPRGILAAAALVLSAAAFDGGADRLQGPAGAPRAQSSTVSVDISGSSYVTDPGDEEYSATVSNGTGTWTYTWEQNVDNQGWSFVGTQNPIQYCIDPLPGQMGAHSYTLGVRVTATNGTTTVSDTDWVTVSLQSGLAYPCTGGGW